MNILIVVHVYPPEHAPAGVMVKELSESLAENGHQVTVLTGWPHHPQGKLFTGWKRKFRSITKENGVSVIRCNHSIRPGKKTKNRLLYYFTFAFSTFINGLRHNGGADVVFCLSTPIFGSWSARLLAVIKHAAFVYGIYDLHPESALNAGMLTEKSLSYRSWRWQDSLLCRHSHAIITLSQQLKQAICQRGISAGIIRVIPLWIDPERITPRNRLNQWRRDNGIADETFVVLYAGTIGHISGVDILLETAEALKSSDDIVLLCVGEGVAKDSLKENAEKQKLDNIRFLPFQKEEDLADMQATADIGLVTLLPQAGETSVPSKVLGYMAAGRAVIASVSDDSATAQIINEADCGIVTAPCDGKALADSILTLYNNRDICSQYGDAARAYVIKVFSKEKNIEAYINLFTEVAK